LKRIILTLEPALHRRGVELRIAHQMGHDVFDQPLITDTLLVPGFCWEVGKIVLETLGFFPKQIGSLFPRTHRFTPQWAGNGHDATESGLNLAIQITIA